MHRHIDPVAVAIYALSPMLGEVSARFAGPYAVIILAAAVGAGWSLGRSSKASLGGALGHFALIIGTAVLVTWGVSAVLSHYTGLDSHWLLAPVALFIGGIGSDWPRVGQWFVARLGRIFERRTGSGD